MTRESLKRAHEGDDIFVERYYGLMLMIGFGGEQGVEKAEPLLIEFSHKNNNPFNCLGLANHYLSDKYFSKDIETARSWIKKAVELADGEEYIHVSAAIFALEHPESDAAWQDAKEKLEDCGKNWDTEALSALGKMHELGHGVAVNLRHSAMFYQLAMVAKEPDDIESYKRVTSKLSRLDQVEVDKRVAQFKASHPISEEQQSDIDYSSAANVLSSDTALHKMQSIMLRIR